MKINSPVRTFEVEVEGEKRNVRLALNYYALSFFADQAGIDFKDLDAAMAHLTADKFPALIEAAMRGVNPNVTPEEVREFIGAIAVPDMPAVMQELLASSNTPAGNGGQAHPPKGGRSTT